MKKIKFYSSALLLIIGLAFIGITTITNYLQKKEITQNQVSVQDQYLKQLKDMEKEVWTNLAKFDVTPEKVRELREKDYSIYLQMNDRPYTEPVSQEIKELAKPIFEEFGVDIEKIALIKWDKHPACASDTKLYINEEDLLALSEDTRRFTIAHELQHIINQDHSTDFFITALLPENERGFNQPYDHPLLKYYRFRELRADMQVALKNEIWAKRYEICMNEIYKYMDGNTNGPMHPKTSERIKIAENVVHQKNMQIIV